MLGLFFREKGWSKKFLDGISKLLKLNLNTFEIDASEIIKVLKKELDAFEVMKRAWKSCEDREKARDSL